MKVDHNSLSTDVDFSEDNGLEGGSSIDTRQPHMGIKQQYVQLAYPQPSLAGILGQHGLLVDRRPTPGASARCSAEVRRIDPGRLTNMQQTSVPPQLAPVRRT
jgi:hypothetical protein